MAIPDFQAIMLPLLELLSSGQEWSMNDAITGPNAVEADGWPTYPVATGRTALRGLYVAGNG